MANFVCPCASSECFASLFICIGLLSPRHNTKISMCWLKRFCVSFMRGRGYTFVQACLNLCHSRLPYLNPNCWLKWRFVFLLCEQRKLWWVCTFAHSGLSGLMTICVLCHSCEQRRLLCVCTFAKANMSHIVTGKCDKYHYLRVITVDF